MIFPTVQITVTGYNSATRLLNGLTGQAQADGLEWSSIIPGGYDEAKLRISRAERRAYPNVYRYGAKVQFKIAATNYLGVVQANAGTIIWEGYSLAPYDDANGTSTMICKGWKELVAAREDPLLWQDRYYGHWQDADGEPFANNSFIQADEMKTFEERGSIGFKLTKQQIEQNDAATLLYCPEDNDESVKITYFRVRRRQSTGFGGPGNMDQMKLKLWAYPHVDSDYNDRLDGGDITLVPGGRDTYTFTHAFSQPRVMIGLTLFHTAGGGVTNPPKSARVGFHGIRVNGNAFRSTADYSKQKYPASEIMKDLAAKLSFTTTRVRTSQGNYLPLFWQGASWTDLFDYLALGPSAMSLADDFDIGETTALVNEEGWSPPAGNFNIQIENEKMVVTARTPGDPASYTITRAQQDTKERNHEIGDGVHPIGVKAKTYVPALWKWAIWEGPDIEFRDWDVTNTTHIVYGFQTAIGTTPDAHAEVQLEGSEDMYTEVDVVWKRAHSMRLRHCRAIVPEAITNMLPAPPRKRVFRVQLQDHYHNNSTPQAVAYAISQELGHPQVNGTLKTDRVNTGGIDKTAYLVKAGEKVEVRDFPAGVLNTAMTAGTPSTINIFEDDFNPASANTSVSNGLGTLGSSSFYIRIDDEWMLVTVRDWVDVNNPSLGHTYTITRAQLGTTAAAHSVGALLFTSRTLRIYQARFTESTAELGIGRMAADTVARMLWRKHMRRAQKGQIKGNPTS